MMILGLTDTGNYPGSSRLLENQHDTVQDIIPDLGAEHHEYLRQMIKIEMIINAIQYCSEIGAFAISIKNKRIFEIINLTVSN